MEIVLNTPTDSTSKMLVLRCALFLSAGIVLACNSALLAGDSTALPQDAPERRVEVPDAPFAMPAIAVPRFPSATFSIADYGARPDGRKCTEAFAAAMRDCERSGGGRVLVPAGTWLTGAVRFASGCELHLAEGAVLEFTDDPRDYPEVLTTWEGVECYNHSPLLYAYGCTNVAITGSGTVRPRMEGWRKWFGRPPQHMKAVESLYYWCSTNCPVADRRLLALDRAHMRPHLIQFNRCRGVLLDGFRIRESPFWMIHLYHSEDCIVRNLDTVAHGHNNDGVDVDMTQNVLIERCRFDQGDDGIVIKAGRNADAWRLNRPSCNVVVRDCDMASCHSLLGIGSELSGGVSNVWMTRCSVADTYAMLRIKTGPRRGGFVENVWIDHCHGRKVTFVANLETDYCAQWGAFPDFELRRTRIRNVNVSDLEAETAACGVELIGDELLPPEDVCVRNVRIGKVTKCLSKVLHCRNCSVEGLEEVPPVVVRGPNYDEAKAGGYTLPAPLTFSDGRKATDRASWAERRQEIVRLFEREMYGRTPPIPEALEAELLEEGPTAAGMGIRRQYRLWFRKDRSGPFLDWLVLLPNRIRGCRPAVKDGRVVCENEQPVPVVLFLNYDGNHTLLTDPEVRLPEGDWTWLRFTPDHKPQKADRGKLCRTQDRSPFPLETILVRGYAVMSACYGQVSPDADSRLKGVTEEFAYQGVFDLWPKRDAQATDNVSSVGAWAWALSRGLDLAGRISEIDATRSVVTGSSRLGKTALLAASRDERFAVCVANQTGGGGCPLSKRDYGENISMMVGPFAHWFCRAYRKYANNEAAMPFDQHLLLASIAPRHLLVEGFNERKFDTKGEFLACQAAASAWTACGCAGFPSVAFPAEYDTSAVGVNLGYVRRGGEHGLNVRDWLWLLDFADRAFGISKEHAGKL